MPIDMTDAQAIWFKDKLYVGGGHTAGVPRDHARLYIYSTTGRWSTIDTPVYYFALVAYGDTESKRLLLLGGKNYITTGVNEPGSVVNTVQEVKGKKILVDKFPPMKVRRCFASAVCIESSLIVAGGEDEKGKMTSIEVFDGQNWTSLSRRLPKASSKIKSIVVGERIYMIGGDGQEKRVFYTLISSLLTGDFKWSSSSVPCEWSTPIIFRNRLMVLGGYDKKESAAFYAFSHSIDNWIHVGDMPRKLYSASVIIQPTGELMVIGGMTKAGFSNDSFKATLTGML